MKEKKKWPLWFCVEPDIREALRRYQWHRHRKKLLPPDYQPDLESLEEIDRLMREAPHPEVQLK